MTIGQVGISEILLGNPRSSGVCGGGGISLVPSRVLRDYPDFISSHTGIDPALSDPVLARRLRENRSLAMSRLDEVISKYAMMQDRNEESERQKRRARLPQATSSHSEDTPKSSLDSGEGPSGVASQECPTTSKAEIDDEEDEESEEEEEEEEDEEDEEEDEEDEEEEDEATDSEEEEDLEQMKEGQGDDEEEEEEAEKNGGKSPMSPRPVSTEKKLEPHKGNSGSSEEQRNKRLTESPSSPAEEPPAPPV